MSETKPKYETPMLVGDDSDYRPEGCTWVAVCVAAYVVGAVGAVVVGNAVGVVNAVAVANGGYYANVAYTENFYPDPPPCGK
jgi:hypothetical protein